MKKYRITKKVIVNRVKGYIERLETEGIKDADIVYILKNIIKEELLK